MRRHFLGLSVFVLIVGISIGAYSFVRSITRSPDIGSVPPVVEVGETPVSASPKDVNYLARLVQYDHKTRRLIARLEVERDAIANHSTVDVSVAVDGSEAGFRSLYFRAIGKLLPGYGEKAIVVIEQPVPDTLRLNPGNNYYVAFRIAQNEDSPATLKPGDFGPESPMVFVHPKTSVTRGPVILQ